MMYSGRQQLKWRQTEGQKLDEAGGCAFSDWVFQLWNSLSQDTSDVKGISGLKWLNAGRLKTIVHSSKNKSPTFFFTFPNLQIGRRTDCACCMGLFLCIFPQHLLLAIVGGREKDWLSGPFVWANMAILMSCIFGQRDVSNPHVISSLLPYFTAMQ